MMAVRRAGTWPFGVAAAAAGTMLLTAALAPLEDDIGLFNAGLLFLLLTLFVSGMWGWKVGSFAAVVTNLALNFFFVEPLHTLAVDSLSNVVTLFVFVFVSLVSGSLLSNARASAEEARRREAETAALLELSRAMVGQTDPNDALVAVCREVVAAFRAPGASLLTATEDALTVTAHAGWDMAARPPDTEERALARHAVVTGNVVKAGDTRLGPKRARIVHAPRSGGGASAKRGVAFVPLRIGGGVLGVLRIDGPVGLTVFSGAPDRMLGAFAGEAALALQRVELAGAASRAEALRRADELKSALMTSISHDLKTPLAGIKTAASSLLDRTVSWSEADEDDFLQTIDSQADRLDRIISDILDLNRIASGAAAPLFGPVNVGDLLDDARQRSLLVTRGRVVETSAPAGLVAVTDESLVAQALANLVENAAKHSTPGRDIRLAACATGSDIEITVEDEGPGISPRDLPHVFERFYRARTTDRRVVGSGLGLAIVSAFVSLCGGTVRAESSERGTKFILTLPGTPA